VATKQYTQWGEKLKKGRALRARLVGVVAAFVLSSPITGCILAPGDWLFDAAFISKEVP